MASILYGSIGDKSDAIELSIGENVIRVYEDYDVQMSVLQQPSAFTLRLGWAGVSSALLDAVTPGLPFQLRVADVPVLSGRVDGRRLRSNAGGSYVEVKGRDWMAVLYDAFVEEERSFANKTYFELTRTVLDLVGLDWAELVGTAATQQKAIAGFQTTKVVNEEIVKQVQTGALDPNSATYTSKVVNKTLKAKLGERWLDWLNRQYKQKGLFLWCAGEGYFVLSEPEWDQLPAFTLLKSRGMETEYATILDTDWNDDTTQRHSEIKVYGRAGGGATGRAKVTGSYVDEEMVSRGLAKRLVVHDDDVKSAEEAGFVARRMAAEERRAGWNLTYTVSGHTMPSIQGAGTAIWGPNLVARVSDDEVPIEGSLYVESVRYSRKPDTTTTITLMRPEDLIFAKPELVNRAPKLKRHPKG